MDAANEDRRSPDDERRITEAQMQKERRIGWTHVCSGLAFCLVSLAALIGDASPAPFIGAGIALILIGAWTLRATNVHAASEK